MPEHSEHTEALDLIARKPDLLKEIGEILAETFNARSAELTANPSLVQGPGDERLVLTRVFHVDKEMGHENECIPLTLNNSLAMHFLKQEHGTVWLLKPAWERVKRAIEEAVPELPPQEVRESLIEFVPHTVCIATIVWYEEKILMRLKNSGTIKNPASVIEFPHATMLGHDASFDEASLRIAKSAFLPIIKPNWDVQLTDHWKVLTPDRPEILLIRHADFIGNPEIFFGTWAEEQYYPYVWVSPENVFDASCGENSALVEEIRKADELYCSIGRDLITEIDIDDACVTCGSTLKSSSHKLPIKSSLIVSDDLEVDASCLAVMESMHF